MGCSRHCSEEERSLVKKLIKEGKTYNEVQKMIGCSAKMISNAYQNGSQNQKGEEEKEKRLFEWIGE